MALLALRPRIWVLPDSWEVHLLLKLHLQSLLCWLRKEVSTWVQTHHVLSNDTFEQVNQESFSQHLLALNHNWASLVVFYWEVGRLMISENMLTHNDFLAFPKPSYQPQSAGRSQNFLITIIKVPVQQ